ncbi:MAG: TetR/AcrR family transcriptional regulator [Chloroflexaceae bacterium]|nr:TetR/AcrR family transcriptional regulator [Chloroflexaceae bacterium]
MLTTMNDDAKTGRLSAAERRNELIEAAIHEFAINGLAGSSTEAISAKVGVSQPYIFKLFGTKKKLFLAAYERVITRMEETLDAAAAAHPEDPEGAMMNAYRELLQRRDDQLLQMQAYAAAADDEVRAYVRKREACLYAEVLALTAGDADKPATGLPTGCCGRSEPCSIYQSL